ncbi:stage V sporulation protein B [Insulibacter thermoxylanivorax]|uniref:Stage V sporulation protein B n=1 Tax=Insulibacter thermoxylanivorax TaxID=2749268 RepID=A0A916QE94_9BACL|nr:stage V sporulation protein B [Insulibacter thermoxylanivorax]GFR38895.1 stage V sporulation protein B [Insulibacter thermoxylanivorax]
MNKIKQSFIHGTIILLAAGIINRILGFVPRITLPRVIGAEGVGLYQMGYPLLNILITIITGGLPLAIAKLVSEAESSGDEQMVRRILRVSLTFVIVGGLCFSLFCLWIAPYAGTHLMTDRRVIPTIAVMSPIITVVGISSVFRGYFQGRQNMIPTAASQILETIVRIFAMLLFAWFLLPYGVEWAAAGAMAGVLLGEIGGLIALLMMYRRHHLLSTAPAHAAAHAVPYSRGRHRAAFRKLMQTSIPVTAARFVGSGSYLLESIITVHSLAAAGIATAMATAQYGALQGMVIPILLLPGVLTYSLSVSLVPSLSEASARGDMRTIHKRLHQSMRLALVAGAPFAVIMYLLADPLTYYLYADGSIGHLLRLMAPAAIFLYFQNPLQAALQALDHPGQALFNSFAGACVKLTLIVLLAAKLKLGIVGVILAINVNIVLVSLLHYISVMRTIRFRLRTADVFMTAGCSAAMGIVMLLARSVLWQTSGWLNLLASIGIGLTVYLAAVFYCGLIDKHDLIRIPWLGPRLRRIK